MLYETSGCTLYRSYSYYYQLYLICIDQLDSSCDACETCVSWIWIFADLMYRKNEGSSCACIQVDDNHLHHQRVWQDAESDRELWCDDSCMYPYDDNSDVDGSNYLGETYDMYDMYDVYYGKDQVEYEVQLELKGDS